MTESKFTPGPWKVGYRAMDVGCENEKAGGYAKLFDVRGWGYLTGHGHGGLGLDAETAYEIQKANAQLAAAAPDLLAVLKELIDILRKEAPGTPLNNHRFDALGVKAYGVIAKAESRSA